MSTWKPRLGADPRDIIHSVINTLMFFGLAATGAMTEAVGASMATPLFLCLLFFVFLGEALLSEESPTKTFTKSIKITLIGSGVMTLALFLHKSIGYTLCALVGVYSFSFYIWRGQLKLSVFRRKTQEVELQ